MRWRKGAACLMVAMLCGPAVADALLPIGGAFGDEAGCEFFTRPGFITRAFVFSARLFLDQHRGTGPCARPHR